MEDSDGGLPYVHVVRGLPWSLTSFKARVSIYDSDDPEYALHSLINEDAVAYERNNWTDLLSIPCFKTLRQITLDIY